MTQAPACSDCDAAPWRLLPSWNLSWPRKGGKRRLDPRELPEHLLRDIGLTDIKQERPKDIRD